MLEHSFICLDRNGNWLFVQGGLELSNVHGGDIIVGLSGHNSLGFSGLAAEKTVRFCDVWVVTFGLKRMVLGIEEGSVLHTSVATKIQPGAVHKLLLREGDQLSCLEEMGTLHRSGG